MPDRIRTKEAMEKASSTRKKESDKSNTVVKSKSCGSAKTGFKQLYKPRQTIYSL